MAVVVTGSVSRADVQAALYAYAIRHYLPSVPDRSPHRQAGEQPRSPPSPYGWYSKVGMRITRSRSQGKLLPTTCQWQRVDQRRG